MANSDSTLNLNINSNAAEFQATLKEIVVALDRLNKSVEQMGERMAQGFTKPRKAQERLKQGTVDQRKEMAALKREIREVEGNFVGSAKKRAKALDALLVKQKRLTAAMVKTGKVAQDGANNAAAAQSKLNKQVSLGRQLFLRLKSVMLTVFGAYAFIQGIRNTINTIKEFELGVARVQAITGATADEIDRLANSARVLGSSGIFNAAEVTELQVILAKLGFTINEIANSTEGIVNLATATGEDLASAAETVASVIRGLGLDASATNRIVDVLGKSFTSSALDLNKFRESAKFLVPLAKEMGWTIEQLAATLGKLADNIISGSLAGTGMRTLFIELADPTSKLSKIMGEGVNTFDEFVDGMIRMQKEGVTTAEVLEAVPKRAVTLFVSLMNMGEGVRTFANELENANGAIEEMADVQLDTLAYQMERSTNAWQGFILAMQSGGGILQDIFQGMADTFNGMARALNPMTFALADAAETVKKFLDVISEREATGKIEIIRDRMSELGDESGTLKEQIKELNEEIENFSDFGVEAGESIQGLNYDLKQTEARLANVIEQIRILNGEVVNTQVAELYERESARIKTAIEDLEAAGLTSAQATLEVYQDALLKWQSFQDNFTAEDPLSFFVFADVEDLIQKDLNDLFKRFAKEEEDALEESIKAWNKYIKDRRDLINAEKQLSIEQSENIKQSDLQLKLDLLKINRDFRRATLKLDIESGKFSEDVVAIKNKQLLELEDTYWRERQEIIDKNQEEFDKGLEATQKERLSKARKAADDEILLQEKLFAVKIQEMRNAGASEEEIALETLKFQAKIIEAQILVAKAFNVTAVVIKQMAADLALINAEIEGFTFSVDDEDVEEVEDKTEKMAAAYKKLATEILQSLSTIADAQVENTSRLVDDLDTRIAETQRELERETELYIEGYANNVSTKKKELAELKQARDQALKEREAAVKRQQALEAITQGVNLASAVAQVINTYSGIPFLGPAIAAAVVAGFLALFLTSQSKIKSAVQFGEGGRVDGRSHSQGGVAAELEGGEYVIKKSSYAKHSALVEAINKDEIPTLNKNILNNTSFDKSGDVIVSTKEWGEIRDLLADNLNKKTTEVYAGKRIVKSGIKTRITKNV